MVDILRYQAKQATSSAAATVSQEATKAVTTQAKQATSSATAPLNDEAQTEARTQAEAELEALFK
ncbi:hypothetical protein [Aeromonas enteropelogenes]|uniref:hypothetical protein n=1 Tax=Aeromonas enteropelogenes TaxID=29489 RepID=UPI000F526894|nr:hypothetical protein [Aeromonas enteropelogenes]RQM65600.1 hypothetical protein EHZ64_09230 [Aeromonas enteropelogenes]